MKMPIDKTRKMKELILYVARKSENDPNFGATKLNKILFYADFNAYLRYGKSITEQRYQKLERGPAPRCLLPIRQDMIKSGEAILRQEGRGDFVSDKLFAIREPNISIFSPEEVSLVDDIICNYAHLNNTDISNESHDFSGWQVAELGEDIPYECVLVMSDDNLTDTERKYGFGLETLAAEVLRA